MLVELVPPNPIYGAFEMDRRKGVILFLEKILVNPFLWLFGSFANATNRHKVAIVMSEISETKNAGFLHMALLLCSVSS